MSSTWLDAKCTHKDLLTPVLHFLANSRALMSSNSKTSCYCFPALFYGSLNVVMIILFPPNVLF